METTSTIENITTNVSTQALILTPYSALPTVILISNIASLFGALYILIHIGIIYFKVPEKHRVFSKHHHTLSMYCVSCIITCSVLVIFSTLDTKNPENLRLCIAQGALQTLLNMFVNFWSTMFILNVLIQIILSWGSWGGEKVDAILVLIYHVVSWGTPVVLMTILLTRPGVIAYSGGWCWISKDYPELRFGLFYGWAIAGFLLQFLSLILIVKNESRS
ncbi:cAMP receptor [Acrasis kona]|uniref:cAMP receptor n=1 Tax=Acrasis kona TaxID=1008807 RepID=A0AAW2YWT8_9EUKA